MQMSTVNDLDLSDLINELGELMEMTYGPKPDDELQLFCRYHRWENAETNDRMFNKHTDETTRYFQILFSIEPKTDKELRTFVFKRLGIMKEKFINAMNRKHCR